MDQANYRAISEKREMLRGLYHGMMTLADVSRELNVDKKVARVWLMENQVEGVMVGKRVKYETDQIAKVIVNLRGMC